MAALIIGAVVSIPVPLSGVHAQPPPPFTAYGVGLTPGVTVAALVNGAICDNSIAGNEGRWVIHFGSDAPCLPTERNLVGFTINGVAAEQTEL